MNFESAVRAAERLVGDSARRDDVLAVVQDLLATDGALMPIPQPETPAEVVCVDGAVISTQTDIVTWIAVSAANSLETVSSSAATVTTVGSHADTVRAAVMAAAELYVAVRTATETGAVWMDGSLATPLISIAKSMASVPDVEAAEFAGCLRDLQVVQSVADYVALAHAGRLRSLPKQDTSRGFVDLWAPQLDDITGRWLNLQRDRMLMGELLPAGFVLAPRSAPEVAAVELVEPRADDLRSLFVDLRQALSGWSSTSPHVTYLMPSDLMRPIKIEFSAPADQARTIAVDLAGQIDPLCHGPRMLEPYPQFVVDAIAKAQVQFTNRVLAEDVAAAFGESRPELVRAYRT